MGGRLATAVGTAANESEGTLEVQDIMVKEGVPAQEAMNNAPHIYEAVQEFIENTEFTFKPGKKY